MHYYKRNIGDYAKKAGRKTLLIPVQNFLFCTLKSFNYSINMNRANFNNSIGKLTISFVVMTIFLKNIHRWFGFIGLHINGVLFWYKCHFSNPINNLADKSTGFCCDFQLVRGL